MEAFEPVSGKPLAVVIAGGGVAALEAALALRDLAEERVELTLLSPSTEFHYRPLATAEPFDPQAHFELSLDSFATDCGAELRLGALERVEPDRRIVRTAAGERVPYDALLVVTGARASESIPRALTFWAGPGGGAFATLLEELRAGAVHRVAFAVPGAGAWALPLYELALMTSADVAERGLAADLTLVTPEARPLEVFGNAASDAVEALLAERGIRLAAGHEPQAVVDGGLAVSHEETVAADAVVALPALSGPGFAGLPQDPHGFVPTDPTGVVEDVPAVFAAGDVTTFPVKQGGLAAQQADTAARTIAALAGAPVTPEPFRPVLRGRLLTGGDPLYLRAELEDRNRPATSEASTEPLWWPPAKIFGPRVGPYLAERAERGS